MVERIFPAQQDQLEQVQRFVEEQVEQYECPDKVKFQLAVAVEEIFVNIAHYAYHPEQAGTATIRCCVGGDPLQVTIQFLDNGKPFNPLAKEDADITLSAEEAETLAVAIETDEAGAKERLVAYVGEAADTFYLLLSETLKTFGAES